MFPVRPKALGRKRGGKAAQAQLRASTPERLTRKQNRELKAIAAAAAAAQWTIPDLRRLWAAAARRNVDASKQLLDLLSAHPRLRVVFASFRAKRNEARGLETKTLEWPAAEQVSMWAGAGRGKRVTVVSGGLPTLGKRR